MAVRLISFVLFQLLLISSVCAQERKSEIDLFAGIGTYSQPLSEGNVGASYQLGVDYSKENLYLKLKIIKSGEIFKNRNQNQLENTNEASLQIGFKKPISESYSKIFFSFTAGPSIGNLDTSGSSEKESYLGLSYEASINHYLEFGGIKGQVFGTYSETNFYNGIGLSFWIRVF